MDKRARSRSGSEEREVLQNRFRKIRKEKRSGVSFKRRYCSACLKLLTYFIRVLTAQTEHPDYDPYDPHSLYLERRKLQAEEQLKRVEDYQLPRKDQPLLGRLEPVPNTQDENTGYYSEDSFVAETVGISDKEQEEIECPFGEPRFIEIFHRLVREGKIKKGKVVEPPRVPVVPELSDRLRGPSRVALSGASSSILQSKPKASPSVPPTPVLQSKPKATPSVPNTPVLRPKPKTATSVSSSGHRNFSRFINNNRRCWGTRTFESPNWCACESTEGKGLGISHQQPSNVQILRAIDLFGGFASSVGHSETSQRDSED